MSDKLIIILPIITLFLFAVNIFFKGNKTQTYLLFVLAFLPLMDLRITKEAWGSYRTFDAISFYSIIFLFKDFTKFNLKNRSNNVYFFLFLGIFSVAVLGSLDSEFVGRTLLTVLKITPIFIFGRFFITECFKDDTFYLKAIKALKIAYIIDLSFIVIQFVVGLDFTFYPSLSNNTVDPDFNIIRFPGYFYDSQASGQFLAMGSFLFLFNEDGLKKKSIIINYLIFVVAIGCIAMAGSRSAIGGFFVGLVIVFIMSGKQVRNYGLALIFFLTIVFSIVSPPSPSIFNRTENISEDYLFRQSLWQQAFEIAKKYPLLGIGYGNYEPYVTKHVQDQYLELEPGVFLYFDQPENGYLKIMVEFGFLGFGFYALLVFIPLIKGAINYLKSKCDKRISFFMAGIISWLVAFNTVYSIADTRMLIMVTSLLVLIITYPLKKYFTNDAI